jgi:branched-chain amino acid transport system ATP-binding protein
MQFRAEGIVSGYGRVRVLHEVTLHADAGTVVALIGPNGAGKTTFARSLSGLIRLQAGEVWLDDRRIHGLKPAEIVRAGVVQVPEGRQLFSGLSVEENLATGAYSRRNSPEVSADRERMFELFPILSERLHQEARLLSGGEQQMLAIARALMARPRVLILDEPSQGLAPKVVAEIGQLLRNLAEEGLAILLIEQNLGVIEKIADRVILIESGRKVIEGAATEVIHSAELRHAYLGG